jgi:cytochrome c oxidase subunit 3
MSDSIGVLRKPWPSLPRQREGVEFGMWVFLASEILFFSGLFLSYAVYRTLDPASFDAASRETNIVFGTINTALLITSSFVMTLAGRASENGWRRMLGACLLATAAFGVAFLIVKGFEYSQDLSERLVPGADFPLRPAATRLFFAIYWVSTGVHATHLAIGVGLVAFLGVSALRRNLEPASASVEAASLYWHLVDSIWIVLYALLYLPGRA